MAKKIVKKRKLKVTNFLIGLVLLLVLVFGVFFILHIKVKNLIVKGNTYLSDDYILEKGKVIDYPEFFLTSSHNVEKRLLKSRYIESASMKKKGNFTFEITIKENKPLFFDLNKNKYVFENGKTVRDGIFLFNVPRLINYVPDKKYTKFLKAINAVDDDILYKISDIEYQPNDYDKDRFLLYMDDGNAVYLTLTKFKMINHYNDVLKQLDNHKGILYLDSGNHFKIME